ncbi:hypothetical protein ACFOY4_09845 [Actinomadura syzygii]|uniref:Matrixin family metalloprotease n=1 Tax=Actinomadura syzygii TaxID=1427538 RepID=A0A5D0UFH1_9ACTN|nr:hypothetical protein [Actinomadura syzygii]TYC15879.1 hypothetical protein FXF65_11095 [Actinomadura syzygii]
MHRRISALLTILALSLTAALLGAGPASASPLDPPTGTTDSQTEPGDEGGDPGNDPRFHPPPRPCSAEPCLGSEPGTGGGGDPGDTPSPEQRRAIDNAVNAAKRALVDKPKCFDTLSPTDSRSPDPTNPITALDTADVLFTNQTVAAAAYASRENGKATIGIYPGFFSLNIATPSVLGYVDPDIYFDLPTVQLSTADLQLVTMLHELGHLTGVNTHPDATQGPLTPEKVNQKFNTQIYVYCLDQGAAYQ